jgi:hypothetical protein
MTESNDYEWLLARERGEDISHVPAHMRDRYSQLDRLIQDLPACAPSPGWKQRVLDSLDDQLVADRPRIFPLATARSRVASPHRSAPRPPRHWQWALGSAAASLAAVFALCAVMTALKAGDPTPQVISAEPAAESQGAATLDRRGVVAMFDDGSIEVLRTADVSLTAPFVGSPLVGVRRAARQHRGEGAALNIGDTLVLEAAAERPIELRVYGDTGEPLARCTETQGCRVHRVGARRVYHLELEARAPGALRTMAYVGGAMPAPFVSLDADLEAAARAGIDMREISVVRVE